jgi:hypothetical protein
LSHFRPTLDISVTRKSSIITLGLYTRIADAFF